MDIWYGYMVWIYGMFAQIDSESSETCNKLFFCKNKFLNIFSTGWDLEKFRKCTILRDIPCLELDGGTTLKKLNC